MELGKLIEVLEDLSGALEDLGYNEIIRISPMNIYITGLTSWRGSYELLSLKYSTDKSEALTTSELIAECHEAINGRFFYGYKGGEFTMSKDTEVWVDNYGEFTQTKISNITQDNGYIYVEVEQGEY